MKNPFEIIDSRLSNIENLLIDIKHKDTNNQPETEQLLTVEQCAKYLNLSKPTIYGLISKKSIPYMKRGKRVYFSKVEVLEYLKEGRRKTNSEVANEAEQLLIKKKGNYILN